MSLIDTLQRIHKATIDTGFTHFEPGDMEHAEELTNKGLIEVNPTVRNDMGFNAVRSTSAAANALTGVGVQVDTSQGVQTPMTQHPHTAKYAIEKGIQRPARVAGFQAKEKGPSEYPFEIMDVGDSFFLPETADAPEPAKKHGPAMSRANKDLWPKRFAMSKVPGGARCFRVEDDKSPVRPEPRKRAPRKEAPVGAPMVPTSFSAPQPQPSPGPAATPVAGMPWGTPAGSAALPEGWGTPEPEGVDDEPTDEHPVVWE